MYLMKREWRSNLKSLAIWIVVCGLIMTMSLSMFPSFASRGDYITEVMASFPEEMLKAIQANNLDFSNPLDYFGYIYQYVLLGAAAMAMLLGIHSLGKEENDKTIEFLAAKPISRTRMVVEKMMFVTASLIGFSLMISGISFILLKIVADADVSFKFLTLVFSCTLFTQLLFAFIGIFLSTMVVKSRIAMPIALGVVFTLYFTGMIESILSDYDWLGYVTPFSNFNVGVAIKGGTLDGMGLLLTMVSVVILASLSFLMYNKKDFTN